MVSTNRPDYAAAALNGYLRRVYLGNPCADVRLSGRIRLVLVREQYTDTKEVHGPQTLAHPVQLRLV